MTNLDDANAVRCLSSNDINKLLKPDLVRAINALLQDNAASTASRNDVDMISGMLKEILTEIRTMSAEKESLRLEVESLRKQQTSLMEKVMQKKNEHDEKDQLPLLLLGDSLIRDVDERKLDHVKVISSSGAKLTELSEVLQRTEGRFTRIVICGGTNDCSVSTDDFDLDSFSENTKNVVRLARAKVDQPQQVVMYTIPPRLDDAQFQQNVVTANACIMSLA